MRLFLAKKGDAWLPDDDNLHAVLQGRDFSSYLEVRPSWKLAKPSLFGPNMSLGEDVIHVLVVVPEGSSGAEVRDMKRDGRRILKFNEPLEDSELEHEGGVPATFRTLQKATVAAFASLLDRIPVIFIGAPPMTGQTAMCDLLYNHIVRSKPDALVSRIRANRMSEDGKFAEFFKFLYGCNFEAFCALQCYRVVLIDEAQITYNDQQMWRGYVKDALDSQIPGLRFVLFSSYGSFNVYRKHERAGPPIFVPPRNIFGINATPYKPGLQRAREELEEMAQNSIGI